MKQYVGEETTSAVAKVTSIELGRRWRLIYSGRAGEKNRLGRKREVRGSRVDFDPSGP